jgi:hypothetical protein
MTEGEWLACKDPTPMLEFLRGKASDRKLRLFAVKCCRGVWHAITVGAVQSAVELTDRYADGEASAEELQGVNHRIGEIAKIAFFHGTHLAELGQQSPFSFQHAAVSVAEATSSSLGQSLGDHEPAPGECAASIAGQTTYPQDKEIYTAERTRQADLARDLFRNPFRPVSFNPLWLTPTVLSLAQSAYDERIMPSGELEPECLAVLSDALEEAGCDDEEILSHLRSAACTGMLGSRFAAGEGVTGPVAGVRPR